MRKKNLNYNDFKQQAAACWPIVKSKAVADAWIVKHAIHIDKSLFMQFNLFVAIYIRADEVLVSIKNINRIYLYKYIDKIIYFCFISNVKFEKANIEVISEVFKILGLWKSFSCSLNVTLTLWCIAGDYVNLNFTGQSISSLGKVPIKHLPGKRHITWVLAVLLFTAEFQMQPLASNVIY